MKNWKPANRSSCTEITNKSLDYDYGRGTVDIKWYSSFCNALQHKHEELKIASCETNHKNLRFLLIWGGGGGDKSSNLNFEHCSRAV